MMWRCCDVAICQCDDDLISNVMISKLADGGAWEGN
jgi:hypothetical protein